MPDSLLQVAFKAPFTLFQFVVLSRPLIPEIRRELGPQRGSDGFSVLIGELRCRVSRYPRDSRFVTNRTQVCRHQGLVGRQPSGELTRPDRLEGLLLIFMRRRYAPCFFVPVQFEPSYKLCQP